jgi:predicted small lipoprotein YifL
MQRKLILGSLLGLMLMLGLAACGKRGDPYRPSEIPAESQTETPAS